MSTQTLLFEVKPTGHKVSKRKSPLINRIKVDHQLAKSRYYFHRRLKGKFPIDPAKRIIDVSPYKALEDIPVKERQYISKLIDLGYNVQLMILCHKTILKPKKKKALKRKTRSTPVTG